eukprot:g7297.t1
MRPIPLFVLHSPDNDLPECLEIMAGSGAVVLLDAETKRVAARWNWPEIVSFRAKPSADPSDMDLFSLQRRAAGPSKSKRDLHYVFECDDATAIVDALDDADANGKSVATLLPCHATCYFAAADSGEGTDSAAATAAAAATAQLPQDEELVVAVTKVGVRFVRGGPTGSGAAAGAGAGVGAPGGGKREAEPGAPHAPDAPSHRMLLRYGWGELASWRGAVQSTDPDDMELFVATLAAGAELVFEVDDSAALAEGWRRGR